MNPNPNTKGILKHAKEKQKLVHKKVEEAIKVLIKNQRKINFNSVSEEANVSKSFLYNNADIRERIETLRIQQEGVPSSKQIKRQMSEVSKDIIISSLRNRCNLLERENLELKKQLQINLAKFYQDI